MKSNVLKLTPFTTNAELLNDVEEAIATLLSNVEQFPCIEDVTRISHPLMLVRMALKEGGI